MPAEGTIIIVDAYSSASRLAPLFREKGYDCVHVQSTPTIPEVYAQSFLPTNFTANIVHDGDVAATVGAVAAYKPAHLLAGIEIGVELADSLSEAIGVLSNGTAGSLARRDKYRMAETVGKAGLRTAAQILTADEDTLTTWYSKLGGRVVVKPAKSAGNDGVFFCDTSVEMLDAFRILLDSSSVLALRNDAVLVQEYLFGGEYYVNTVSRDGRHHVCDLWKTNHLAANGVRDLLDCVHMLPRRGAVQNRLVAYTYGVLDALTIRHGPAHTELKLTPDGPVLIETGARVCGGNLPNLVRQAIGESQYEWTVEAYLRPERFHARCDEDYQINRHAAAVGLISPMRGTLTAYPRLDEVSSLDSFAEITMNVRPGERIHRTIDDFTYPMLVNLLHEVDEIVLHDYGTIRQLDGPHFYEIADD